MHVSKFYNYVSKFYIDVSNGFLRFFDEKRDVWRGAKSLVPTGSPQSRKTLRGCNSKIGVCLVCHFATPFVSRESLFIGFWQNGDSKCHIR
jgi:hypothetical protein